MSRDELLPRDDYVPPTPEHILHDARVMVHRKLGEDCDDILETLGLDSVKVESKYPPK